MRKIDWVHLANTQVRIEKVLNDLYGIEIPEGVGNWRAACPKGIEHRDGGLAKSMRVFSDSNTAWCFSHSESFTPVSLWQNRSSVSSRVKAAKQLLGAYGFPTEPPSLEERWKSTQDEAAEDLDPSNLRSALVYFAKTQLPGYVTRQYEGDVMNIMSNLLESVDDLPPESSYDTMVQWMNKSKGILKTYWRNNGWH